MGNSTDGADKMQGQCKGFSALPEGEVLTKFIPDVTHMR